jgi:hypothetical protein
LVKLEISFIKGVHINLKTFRPAVHSKFKMQHST